MIGSTFGVRLTACLVIMVAAGCGPSGEPPRTAESRSTAEPTITVRAVDPDAAPGSGEPNLTVAPDGRVLLSWIERLPDRRHRLRYATRAAGGDTAWSKPQSVAEGPDWFVNWADFPSVAALADGTLFAHWLVKSGPDPYAYDVNVASSGDGATWTPPVVVHRDGVKTEHGFVSMTPWDDRSMGLVWLDGRTMGASSEGHGVGGGAMTLMQSTMDRNGVLGGETVVDARVCDCCQTDVARAEGAVVVVYRDRSEKEVRDIAVTRFVDGAWSAPRPLATDGWEIAGCPVNGPAVAASGTRVAAAWFTAAGGAARVKVALSTDSGATFGPPIVVDDGAPMGRVDVVTLDDGSAAVSWLEGGETGASLRIRRMGPDGIRSASTAIAATSVARSSGFPRLAYARGEVIAAWRDAGEPARIRAAVLTLGNSR